MSIIEGAIAFIIVLLVLGFITGDMDFYLPIIGKFILVFALLFILYCILPNGCHDAIDLITTKD